jgi:LmbE family N-acetylglucosaminyl deacetylase
MDKKKKILIVAAHPDDEILGCGGSVVKSVKEGYSVSTLILGEGITSRDKKRNRKKREEEIKQLKEQIYKANAVIGVKDVFIYDLPDNRFDEVALLDIVKVIENIKEKIRPDIVYTHHRGDLNIDHRITLEAVLTACRPIEGETVKEIYSFEAPSSTEWNYPYIFSPNVFIEIAQTIEEKIKAFKCYKTELRRFPHPRSEEAVRCIAKRWGIAVGLKYAEAFEVVRVIQ